LPHRAVWRRLRSTPGSNDGRYVAGLRTTIPRDQGIGPARRRSGYRLSQPPGQFKKMAPEIAPLSPTAINHLRFAILVSRTPVRIAFGIPCEVRFSWTFLCVSNAEANLSAAPRLCYPCAPGCAALLLALQRQCVSRVGSFARDTENRVENGESHSKCGRAGNRIEV